VGSTYSGPEAQIKQFLCTPSDASTSKDKASNDLYNCINRIYRFALVTASFFAVFMIVLAGWVYMSAEGNEESVTKAKDILVTSIASIVILSSGYVLLKFINPDLIQFQPIQPPSVVGVERGYSFDKIPDSLWLSLFGTQGKDATVPQDRKPNTTKEGCDYKNASIASKHMVTINVKAWDTAGNTKMLPITINKEVENKVRKIFDEIYNSSEKFPINSLGAFNYNFIVAPDGSKTLSGHACGLAIDINPDQNPFVVNGKTVTGTAWRPCPASNCSRLSIATNSSVVKAFKANGFGWGGEWKSAKDYMHFSCIQNEYGSCPFLKD
jgi:hypothetical protein